MPEPRLEFIHLQLTRNCNLRCPFCGQWGENGFMKRSVDREISTGDWLGIIEQAKKYRAITGINPEFIIWGGEPLLSDSFVDVCRKLKLSGFPSALVTNGVLLKDFAEVVNENFDTVYVSLDGPKEVHEQSRGQTGIFDEIIEGVERLDKERLVVVDLFTVNESNILHAGKFPHELSKYGFHKIIFQNLIYCSSSQADKYRDWLRDSFSLKADTVDSWVCDSFGKWTENTPAVFANIRKNIMRGKYEIEVEIFPDEIFSGNENEWFSPQAVLKKTDSPCLMPWRHLHIAADGEARFCVDFSDFTLGNVRDSGVMELFTNERAKRFRSEYATRNTLCGRCPWFYNNLSEINERKKTCQSTR